MMALGKNLDDVDPVAEVPEDGIVLVILHHVHLVVIVAGMVGVVRVVVVAVNEEEGRRHPLCRNRALVQVHGLVRRDAGHAVPSVQEPAKAAPAASAGHASPDPAKVIESPTVGTFYRSSAPGAEPFVKVGSHVEADTTVAVVEAMKVMNEIKAEKSGVIKEILLENGQPVEYGQPLFVLE